MDFFTQLTEGCDFPKIETFVLRAGESRDVLIPVDTVGFELITHNSEDGQIFWATEADQVDSGEGNRKILPHRERAGVMGLELRENKMLYIFSPSDSNIELTLYFRT